VANFRLQTFSIVSGAVSGKDVGFYGRKFTGIFSFGFTILYDGLLLYSMHVDESTHYYNSRYSHAFYNIILLIIAFSSTAGISKTLKEIDLSSIIN